MHVWVKRKRPQRPDWLNKHISSYYHEGSPSRAELSRRRSPPLASASTDRASVFIKAQPVCMTATEMLVSSRLMKTDNSPPQEAVTRNKKAAGWANRRMEDEKRVTITFQQLVRTRGGKKAQLLFIWFLPILDCFSSVISALTPSALFPPPICLDTPPPPSLPLSHTHTGEAATWNCPKMLSYWRFS